MIYLKWKKVTSNEVEADAEDDMSYYSVSKYGGKFKVQLINEHNQTITKLADDVISQKIAMTVADTYHALQMEEAKINRELSKFFSWQKHGAMHNFMRKGASFHYHVRPIANGYRVELWNEEKARGTATITPIARCCSTLKLAKALAEDHYNKANYPS